LAGTAAAERFNPATASSAAFVTTYGGPNAERLLTSFQSYVRDGYAGNPVVFGIIGVRADILSGIRFQFRDLRDKHLFGSPELALLENPWPNGTAADFITRMEQDESLAGNAFARRIGASLERLRPDWVTIVSTVDSDHVRTVEGFVYRPVVTDTGMPRDEVFIPVEDMIHWAPVPDPLANFRGMSWLTSVVREINADTAMTRHKGKFFDNNATPNALVTYKTKLSQGIVAEIQERINERHAGVENAYKTMVLDAGADYTTIGNTLEQMNFATVQAAGENRIAVAAGVPGIVAGLKEGLSAATYSNYAQARRAFADQKAWSLWRSLCAAAAQVITVPPGAELWFDTTDVPALRADELERAQIMQAKAQTYSELVRAGGDRATAAKVAATGEGLEALPATGDVFFPGAQAYSAPGQTSTAAGNEVKPEPKTAPLAPKPVGTPGDSGAAGRSETLAVRFEQAPPQPINITVEQPPAPPAPVVNVTVAPAVPAPPVITVSPTPVSVVTPVTVQPAAVTVLPTKPTTRRIKRNSAGEITSVEES